MEAGKVWLRKTSSTDVAQTFHKRVDHVGGEKSLTKLKRF